MLGIPLTSTLGFEPWLLTNGIISDPYIYINICIYCYKILKLVHFILTMKSQNFNSFNDELRKYTNLLKRKIYVFSNMDIPRVYEWRWEGMWNHRPTGSKTMYTLVHMCHHSLYGCIAGRLGPLYNDIMYTAMDICHYFLPELR